MDNIVSTLAPSFLIGSSSYLQVRRSIIYNISDKFEFRSDSAKDCEVSCPGVSEKIHIDL